MKARALGIGVVLALLVFVPAAAAAAEDEAPVGLAVEVTDDKEATTVKVVVTNHTLQDVTGVLEIAIDGGGRAVAVLETGRQDVLSNLPALSCVGPSDEPLAAAPKTQYVCTIPGGRTTPTILTVEATLVVSAGVFTDSPDGIVISASGTNAVQAKPATSTWSGYSRIGAHSTVPTIVLDVTSNTPCELIDLEDAEGWIADSDGTFSLSVKCHNGTETAPPYLEVSACGEGSGVHCIGFWGGRELTGSLTLIADSDKSDVDVTLQRRHGIWLAIATLLVSLWLAIWYKRRRTGTKRIELAVQQRIAALRIKAMTTADGVIGNRQISKAISKATDEVRSVLDGELQKHKTAKALKASTEFKTGVRQELDTLDKVVAAWPALEQDRRQLSSLWDVKSRVIAPRAPEFAATVAELLAEDDRQISRVEFERYQAWLPAAVDVVKAWRESYLKDLEGLYRIVADAPESGLKVAAQKAWQGFRGDLGSEEDPQKVLLLITNDLAAAARAIAIVVAEQLRMTAEDHTVLGEDDISISPDSVAALIEETGALTSEIEATAKKTESEIAHRRTLLQDAYEDLWESSRQLATLQLALTIVAGVAVIAGGLVALYVGKNWGSAWDYLAALVWGITAGALVDTLVELTGRIGADPEAFIV